MMWEMSHRADPKAAAIADRHYNRQKIGAPQFVPPGRCIVLYTKTSTGEALWVTSWPYAQYVKHDWAGAWICSLFRNEGAGFASDLIREAVAATKAVYGDPPTMGLVTFLDTAKVQPIMTHHRPTFGRTWIMAGFHPCGYTKGGLMAFQLDPADMPDPCPPRGFQEALL